MGVDGNFAQQLGFGPVLPCVCHNVIADDKLVDEGCMGVDEVVFEGRLVGCLVLFIAGGSFHFRLGVVAGRRWYQ